jgi:hypothetical protein
MPCEWYGVGVSADVSVDVIINAGAGGESTDSKVSVDYHQQLPRIWKLDV